MFGDQQHSLNMHHGIFLCWTTHFRFSSDSTQQVERSKIDVNQDYNVLSLLQQGSEPHIANFSTYEI